MPNLEHREREVQCIAGIGLPGATSWLDDAVHQRLQQAKALKWRKAHAQSCQRLAAAQRSQTAASLCWGQREGNINDRPQKAKWVSPL